MAINLTKIKPHEVSRDLSGYITYVYGPPKTGKTTLGSQMPKPLLVAAERGYNALPGVMAQDVTSWSEVKEVVRELKKPEVKEMFSTIIIDTVDIVAGFCEKYICAQKGVNAIGEVAYGGGWALVKKEFEDQFRTITQLGYAVLFISHSKEASFKKKDGTEFTTIKPTVSNAYNQIVENMADLYIYMHSDIVDGVSKVKMTLRSMDGSVAAGGRFKYIAPEIDANYESLVKALNDAIDKEAEINGGKYVTSEKNIVTPVKEFDFDGLMAEFNTKVSELMSKDSAYFGPRIQAIVDSNAGVGHKVSEMTYNQAEVLSVIVGEINDLK